MALISPIYLDVEQLMSHAQYHDVVVPHAEDVIETSRRQRAAGARVGVAAVGVDAGAGTEVEVQSSYRLEPRQQATVSKVVDGLLEAGQVKDLRHAGAEEPVLVKDDLVLLEGDTQMTGASLAGKLFYILRTLLGGYDGALEALEDLDVEDLGIDEELQRVYLRNELPAIPLLLELTGHSLDVRVLVNLEPDHLVGEAAGDRLEGELRVLGTVRTLVDGGDEGYLSTEEWLLARWEYLMRRLVVASLDESMVNDLYEQLDLKLPEQSTATYIHGPAVVLDVVALY